MRIIPPRTRDAGHVYFEDEAEQNKDDVAKSRIPVIYLCSVDVTDIEAGVVRCLVNMWPPVGPHRKGGVACEGRELRAFCVYSSLPRI
jgi:hypothetical protein